MTGRTDRERALARLTIFMVFAAGLSSALVSASSAPFLMNFEGSVVTGRLQRAVVGATIELARDGLILASTESDDTGRFRFAGISVTPGVYVLQARLGAMSADPQTLVVEAGQVGTTLTTVLKLAPHSPDRPTRGDKAEPPPPAAIPPRAGVEPRQPTNAVVQVFYATDRARATPDPLTYGPARASGDALAFGRFDVSIPRDHRLAVIERPSIWRFEFREDPSRHFVIVARKAVPEAEFYREVASVVAASSRKEAFVFIHGYNVAFEDAVYRTAQLAYDLAFPGAAILYSWPSNGNLLEYVGDLNNNDWTVPHLATFLKDVATETHASTVHLIAHSMGNRALANALNRIATQSATPSAHFREVILTAPDIDADVFRGLAQSIQGTADRVTLYASANDKALTASKRIQGYPRAGDASGDVLVLRGIDTVDASALETDFLGHSYFGDRASVISDIFTLLKDGTPPAARFGLQKVSVGEMYYWKFRP